MTNKERVFASLAHRQPDRVPYHVDFTQPAFRKMKNFFGDANFNSRLDNCFLILNTSLQKKWKEIKPDFWRDEFGVIWDRTIDKDIGTPANIQIIPENLKDYVFPDPEDASRYFTFEQRINENPDEFVVANLGFSLFERAWTLAGMENVLMAMVSEPKFVHQLMDRILECNLKIIEKSCSLDIDAMMFGDDWGQQTGVMMGAQRWREFIKPRIKQMYDLTKSHGKRVIIHCCGKVDEIFPDLIEVGVDLFNPFQPEVMDVFEMKKIYGDRLSFYGGISIQKTLPYGTTQQVKDETHRLLDEVGLGGGYVAAPSHTIPGDAKPENIAAMIEVLKNQGS